MKILSKILRKFLSGQRIKIGTIRVKIWIEEKEIEKAIIVQPR